MPRSRRFEQTARHKLSTRAGQFVHVLCSDQRAGIVVSSIAPFDPDDHSSTEQDSVKSPVVMTRHTLPRKRILKSSARISEVFKKGQRRHGRFLSVFVLPAESSHTAFTIPRKYGKAVLRNLQKRRVREIFRLNKNWFPANIDLVILIRARQGIASYDELAKDLRTLAKRLKPKNGKSGGGA